MAAYQQSRWRYAQRLQCAKKLKKKMKKFAIWSQSLAASQFRGCILRRPHSKIDCITVIITSLKELRFPLFVQAVRHFWFAVHSTESDSCEPTARLTVGTLI